MQKQDYAPNPEAAAVMNRAANIWWGVLAVALMGFLGAAGALTISPKHPQNPAAERAYELKHHQSQSITSPERNTLG